MSLITTIFILIMLSLSIVGTAKLWKFATYPGRILGVVDRWIIYAEGKEQTAKQPFYWQLISKSLGGCEVCNRQRFTEIYFVFYIFSTQYKWWEYLFHYMLLCGLVLYATAAYSYITTPKQNKKITTQL